VAFDRAHDLVRKARGGGVSGGDNARSAGPRTLLDAPHASRSTRKPCGDTGGGLLELDRASGTNRALRPGEAVE
jgi:hypothetical protein